jgi:hypothetical protein
VNRGKSLPSRKNKEKCAENLPKRATRWKKACAFACPQPPTFSKQPLLGHMRNRNATHEKLLCACFEGKRCKEKTNVGIVSLV